MKILRQIIIGILLFGFVVLPTHAAFTSLYVFGDALSTTTNNTGASSFPKDYYGNRYSNGRVWVEVLAQRQGVGISNNWSYFDCNSSNLVNNVKNFNITQSAAANALFVVWVNNSDLFDAVMNAPDTKQTTWTAIINRGQANQLQAITTLYNKGVRTIIMPNAVDVGKVPYFYLNNPNFGATAPFIRQECIAYNVAFSNTLNQAMAACPGLQIYEPNFFGLLDNVLTNAASYGLTNALTAIVNGSTTNSVSIDAMDALYPQCNTNGLGDNYVFWDYLDPSARFHEVMADVVQQVVSPAQLQITALNGGSQLTVANMPVGLNGFVDGSTNLAQANWTAVQSIAGTSTTESLFVIAPPLPAGFGSVSVSGLGFGSDSGGSGGSGGPPPLGTGGSGTNSVVTFNTFVELYRLRFPYAWTWP